MKRPSPSPAHRRCRYKGDDDAITDDDEAPASDDDNVSPSDDDLPDNYWTCLAGFRFRRRKKDPHPDRLRLEGK